MIGLPIVLNGCVLKICINMSRSRKKHAIVKDKNGRYYNRLTRRVIKQQVRDIKNLKDLLDYRISLAKEIVNDYDVCDYVIDYENLKGYWKRMMSKSNTEISDAVNKAKRK